jgi:type II secretory pathway component PulL
MPDEDHRYAHRRSVAVMVSAEGIAERLAQLPTRKEMWRAVLLGTTTGACLVHCLAWIFH